MGKVSNGTILVFPIDQHGSRMVRRDLPDGSSDSRDSVLFGDLGFIDGDLGEFTGLLVELDRLGTDRQYG